MFLAHFRHKEEGIMQVYKEASQEVAQDKVEEVQVGQEEKRTVRVNKQLPNEFRQDLLELFQEFQDVFTWDHTELKGIDPRVCQHKIPLRMDARQVRM